MTIEIGTQVEIQEDQDSAPLNGATGIVVAVREYDHAPVYVVEVYGARYSFRDYELGEAR